MLGANHTEFIQDRKGIRIVKTTFPYCILLASVAASLGQSGGTNLTIAVQPQSQIVSNGGTAIFSVTATGPGPLSYTWQFNGTNLPTLITSVAGDGPFGTVGGFSGDGGAATNAGLNNPIAVALDGAGDVFVADLYNGRIRKVDTNGIITTVAGIGPFGYSGDGGTATNANLSYACDVAVDGCGNLFIADLYNYRIREVGTNGIITTVAGNGMQGFSGDGGAATNAELNYAGGVAVDNAGNLFIADSSNNRIRRVDTNGIIRTVAGNGTAGYSGDGGAATNAQLSGPGSVAWGAAGNLYIADGANQRIRMVDANGIITTVAGNGTVGYAGDGGAATNAELNSPANVAVDSAGNLFISDFWNYRVRKVDSNGIMTTVAGNGTYPAYSGDGGAATNAVVNGPRGLALDSARNLFIADYYNNLVRRVGDLPTLTLTNINTNNLGGYSVVVANAGGSVTSSVAVLNMPPYIVSPPVNLTLLEGCSGVMSVTAQGPGPLSYQWSLNATNIIGATNATYALNQVSTNSAGLYAVTVTNAFGSVTSASATLNVVFISEPPTGQIVTAGTTVLLSVSLSSPAAFSYQWQLDGTNLPTSGLLATIAGNGTQGYSGDGGAATNSQLRSPFGVTADATGNVFLTDGNNQRIREVGTNGIITTAAGNGTPGYSGDGGAATNARLYAPYGVAVDAFGNLFIADTENYRIRRVTTNGVITTVAGNGTPGYSGDGGAATNARLYAPKGVAVDAFGNLFIADIGNIREVSTNGVITTVAGNATIGFSGDGGAATNARLNMPNGVAVDTFGNLFIADTGNNRIREVSTNGFITTVAGNGALGYSGDGGTATNARLYAPSGVAVDAFGDLFIADAHNNRIREVTTFGLVTTVAGNGTIGYSGDGSEAINARLNMPSAVAVDTAGDLLVADSGNFRVRRVTGMPLCPSTLSTYEFRNAGSNTAGHYSVIISNAYGSITSTVAIVTVILSPNPVLILRASGLAGGAFALNWSNLTATPPLSYQVQYNSNLASTNWSNLGTLVTGNIPLMNFTDPVGSNVRRFYRVRLVQ
jgi:sugar lactone lactonase YvrE